MGVSTTRVFPVACVLLCSLFVVSEARVSCDKIKSSKRCEKRPECEFDYRGQLCSRTPTAPPPPEDTCTGARRRKCMHKHSPKGDYKEYNAICQWNKATKSCDRVQLCRDIDFPSTYGASWAASRTSAWMATSMFFCVPDCGDNPLNQYMPKEINVGAMIAGIDASYDLWGVDPWDPAQWCPMMYGDLVRGKEAPQGSAWTTKNIGLALNSCDNPPKTQLTDWAMGWNADFLALHTGNTVCCETCGTCQTEKFRCNMVPEDDERGRFPCGSDAWGHKSHFKSGDNCYVGDPVRKAATYNY